jgi:hypothetical protein
VKKDVTTLTPEIKQELGIKREVDETYAVNNGDVEFGSHKRMKHRPSRNVEVIVLD